MKREFRGRKSGQHQSIKRKVLGNIVVIWLLTDLGCGIAYATNVYFAGFAQSGKYSQLEQDYPYSYNLVQTKEFRKQVLISAKNINPINYRLRFSLSKDAKSFNSSIELALVQDGETVSVEKYLINGNADYKLDVTLHAEAVFFDFEKKSVLYSVPISEEYINVYSHSPTESDKLSAIKLALYKNSGNNLLKNFQSAVNKVNLPSSVVKFVRVTNVHISSLAKTTIINHPDMGLDTNDNAKQYFANSLSSALSGLDEIPMEPYQADSTTGKFALVFSNQGEKTFNLHFPAPSYGIDLTIKGFKNVPYSSSGAGYSQIYGAFANIKVYSPLIDKVYLDETFKNGVVKVIPITQVTVAAGPAYLSATNRLFEKFAVALAGKDEHWLKSATSGKHVSSSMEKTYEALESCKL
ncbi:hypothetical protein [Candidatus Igneacidithiobacillus taiwanensis]|uniref:hypothetical protein n=1 Tax=Candidatus Igneacidithiobacillus taiwanensis TaxID=1945924 RepID=UPI0028A0E3BC|nr:hypothetical protein [Candidatus Igneacidithiobacillus taiwanensis]